MTENIPYARPLLDAEDIEAVTEVLKTVWLTQGPRTKAFEDMIAETVGARHAIAVSSGSAALHVAYAGLDIGPGDEIVTSPLTFAATANMAVHQGAHVRFADIDPDRLTIDPAAIAGVINERTKAIVPVDFGGLPCAMDEIRQIADRHGIPVIVDAAHSFGASYKGRPVGRDAAATTFSFHAVKLVAAGEGGAIVTDDDELAARMRRLRSHGIAAGEQPLEPDLARDNLSGQGAETSGQDGTAPWYYEIAEPGWNYRMTDVQCALAASQLNKARRYIARRVEIAARYDEAFADNPLIIRPPRPEDAESAWHLYVIQLRLSEMRATRRQVLEALRDEGIGAHVHYIPVHLQPYYRQTHGTAWGDLPCAEAYYRAAVTLPLHPAMKDEDVGRVIAAVTRTVR